MKEQIFAMTAGKEMDRKIAELMNVNMDLFEFGWEAGNHNYSHDVSCAWGMEEFVYETSTEIWRKYIRELIDVIEYRGRWSLTMLSKLIKATPEQRCKAALLAVMT